MTRLIHGLFVLALLLPLALPQPLAAQGADGESFRIQERPRRQDNILDLFFGTAPELPTQRGTIIITAFHDLNGNGRRDPGEPEIRDDILCTLDDIDYRVPAFIPGLDLGGHFLLSCEGESYLPLLLEPNVFVERRGQIMRVELPSQFLGP